MIEKTIVFSIITYTFMTYLLDQDGGERSLIEKPTLGPICVGLPDRMIFIR